MRQRFFRVPRGHVIKEPVGGEEHLIGIVAHLLDSNGHFGLKSALSNFAATHKRLVLGPVPLVWRKIVWPLLRCRVLGRLRCEKKSGDAGQ